VRAFEGGYEPVIIPVELTKKINTICKNRSVTQFIFILAAFKTLLYRYSGQKDICIGTVVANRNRKEIESAVGFFMNTLALRTQIEGDSCFTEVLERVRNHLLCIYVSGTSFDKRLRAETTIENGVNPFLGYVILQNIKSGLGASRSNNAAS
jgi:non-ribosomal peptide synthetase component F